MNAALANIKENPEIAITAITQALYYIIYINFILNIFINFL